MQAPGCRSFMVFCAPRCIRLKSQQNLERRDAWGGIRGFCTLTGGVPAWVAGTPGKTSSLKPGDVVEIALPVSDPAGVTRRRAWNKKHFKITIPITWAIADHHVSALSAPIQVPICGIDTSCIPAHSINVRLQHPWSSRSFLPEPFDWRWTSTRSEGRRVLLRSLIVESQYPQISTKIIRFQFPFSMKLNTLASWAETGEDLHSL